MNDQAFVPYIPEYITVHLGRPNENAENVTLPFASYIANVASSEIYPTWPEEAIRANIYAQISFALNRIYTEYYRSRGYDFDITNSTAFDQYFVKDREIFENIYRITTELFDDYVKRQGSVEPLFTQYCNGTTVTCNGLSQWGSVSLAERGYTPYRILQNYYGNDIEIVRDAPVDSIRPSAPGVPLRIGSTGDDVRTLQLRLNRISRNFPSIPKIPDPNGIFTEATEKAVRQYQKVMNLAQDGIVGNATWYSVQRTYAAVKKLSELDSEGISLGEVTKQYPELLREGDTGVYIRNLQYFLSYLSSFYSTIPEVEIDGIFGEKTRAAVIDAQNTFGLSPDGVVGENTWNAIYNAYLGIIETIPVEFEEGVTIPYGGIPLSLGSESDSVRVLQEYLVYISGEYPQIPTTRVTGYYGEQTRDAVRAFQREFGLEPSGSVGSETWNRITSIYEDLYSGNRLADGQYPGYESGRMEGE